MKHLTDRNFAVWFGSTLLICAVWTSIFGDALPHYRLWHFAGYLTAGAAITFFLNIRKQ